MFLIGIKDLESLNFSPNGITFWQALETACVHTARDSCYSQWVFNLSRHHRQRITESQRGEVTCLQSHKQVHGRAGKTIQASGCLTNASPTRSHYFPPHAFTFVPSFHCLPLLQVKLIYKKHMDDSHHSLLFPKLIKPKFIDVKQSL